MSCMHVLSHVWHYNPMDCILCPWDYPGKNTWVGFHFLLQSICPTQGQLLCPVLVSPVSCAAGRFFTSWAAGEAPYLEQTASWTQNIKNGTLTTGDAASGIICQKKQEKKTPWVLTNHSKVWLFFSSSAN